MNCKLKFLPFAACMIMLAAWMFAGSSCSDKVDESDLYVFTGKSVTDFIKEDPDLSYYYYLLQHAKSGKKGSTMDHLLEARGNYTVFAPTNDAVQHFIDSIYQTPNYDINEVSDSVAQEIVFNSIIDTGTADAYESTDFREGAFDYKTMADRFATVSFATNDSTNKVQIYINAFSEVISTDNEAFNGWMHVVNRVVMPYASALPDLIAGQDNLQIFAHLLFVTSWNDSLQDYRDEDYEAMEKPERKQNVFANALVPEHRYFGYTAFVEPDSVLCAAWGITLRYENGYVVNWDEVMERVEAKCKEYYPTATSNDLTSEDNAINRFVSYHLMKGSMAYNKLVIHYNEPGYSFNHPERLGIDKMQYYITMGKRRLVVKLTEGAQTDGKRINRYVSDYDWDSYEELEVPRKGILLNPDNGTRDIQALNGFYYTIDDVLWYDDDVPNKVLNERMRWDILSYQPELFTNGLRALPNTEQYYIYPGYLDGMKLSDETDMNVGMYYAAVGCNAFEQDEPTWVGDYDITMVLPPVPTEGTYELRYALANGNTRGMMQVYVGTDPNNLSAIGLPIDMRYELSTPRIGWYDDVDDQTENARNDKAWHNRGIMKGSWCFGGWSYTMTEKTENRTGKIRHIIYTGRVDPDKKYYCRLKNVLTNPAANLDFDYIEWCPKSVYAGSDPEDYW